MHRPPLGRPDARTVSASAPTPPAALLRFALPGAAAVRIIVCAADGRMLRTLRDHQAPAGEHLCAWDGCDSNGQRVAGGTYTVRLEVDGLPLTARVVTLR
jgi:hypothetical protein